MATWQTTYRNASFRGVPFFVDDASDTVGRRTVVHEYPLKDSPDNEDLGRRARRYRINAYVLGTLQMPNYMDGRDALIAALETPGPGTLVHPYFGQLQVAVEGDVNLTQSTREGGMARFSISFVEDNSVTQPADSTDTQQAVSDQASATQATADAQLAASYAPVTNPQISDASAALNAAYALLATVSGGTVLGSSSILAEVQLPAAIAARIDGFIEEVTSFTAFGPLFDFDYTAGPADAVALANRAAISYAVQVAATIGAIALASQTTFSSANAALALRDTLLDQVDAISEGAGDDLYPALQDLRTAFITDIATRSANLATLASFTPLVTMPALAIAQQLYGPVDVENSAADIVARNNILNPGFIPGGVPLEVLSNWTPAP